MQEAQAMAPPTHALLTPKASGGKGERTSACNCFFNAKVSLMRFFIAQDVLALKRSKLSLVPPSNLYTYAPDGEGRVGRR